MSIIEEQIERVKSELAIAERAVKEKQLHANWVRSRLTHLKETKNEARNA